jgi:hypothetical protein
LLACFLLPLLTYLATLTRVHTYDALSYVLDVDRKPWHELFHPHHLAYGPLGALVAALARLLGWPAGARLPMQATNALAGALGVLLFALLLRRVTRRLDVALVGALLLAASYAYWYYAIEVEVYTIAALFLILCLWLLVRLLHHPHPRTAALLGVAQGLAVLFHQTNVLLCVPVAVALLLVPIPTHHTHRAGWRRLVLAAWYGVALAGVVGGAYALVGLVVGDFASLTAFVAWLTAYAHTGWWGGAIDGTKWRNLGSGLAETLAVQGGVLLWLLLVGLLLLFARRLRAYARLVACLLAWLATYGAFFLWWEPQNIEFWIASLPPALLLLALALQRGGAPWHAGVWLALAVGVTVAGINYDAIVARGTPAQSVQRTTASRLGAQSQPGDMLLVADALLELYLFYHEQRPHAVSLNRVLQQQGGDWPAACRHVQHEIDAALGRGAAVWVDTGVLQPTHAERSRHFQDPLAERFRIGEEQVRTCLAAYLPDMQRRTIGADLPTYERLPPAAEVAAGPGWDFSRHHWGWQAENIRDVPGEPAWTFVPGVDPRLTSPPVALQADAYCGLELHMVATAPDQQLEVFFLDEQGMAAQERSIRAPLQSGTAQGTYRLVLRGQPGWEGTISRLRLDPLQAGDGGEQVRLEAVRLLTAPEC